LAVVDIPPFVTTELTATDEWTKHDFAVPNERLPERAYNQCRIASTEAGRLWVDNLLIHQTDVEPFGFMPVFTEALKEMKPSILRSMHYNLYRYTLEGMLGHGFSDYTIWDKKGTGGPAESPHGMGLGGFLKLCAEVGADPWINIHLFTEEECLGLMEYLAGPTDTDYGRRRASDGQEAPWTTVFDRIHIELGNEPWGTLFFPMRPEMFAAACNLVFGQCKASPHYDAGVFNFIGGGWAIMNREGGYNHVLMRDAVEMDTIGAFAGYFGGWDGLVMPGDSDEEFFQNQLLYVPLIEGPRLAGAGEIRELVGRAPGQTEDPLEIACYEYGPGYAVPSPERPFIEQSETVGKSLALGIATLDRGLLFWEYGYRGAQSFFRFGTGPNCTSHSDPVSMRPHPCWLAVSLLNRECRGDLLETIPEQVSTVDVPDMLVQNMDWKGGLQEEIQKGRNGIHMVKCFAFRDADRYALVAYNRWFDTPRSVTLRLPYEPKARVTIYKLTHEDPRATNREELNIEIVTEERDDFSQEYTFGLPPCSAFVLVTEAR